MPLIPTSNYKPPLIFNNRHLNTTYPSLIRKVEGVRYERERLNTPDGDFLDLDWYFNGGSKLILGLHGLEGDAQRPYIQGMLKLFGRHGWDGAGLNFRGCSGELNRLPRSYHIGDTGDLQFVIRHILNNYRYDEIALFGFSLGGNVTLKYLGEQGKELPNVIKRAVAFSVPCHIESANVEIQKWFNRVYRNRFLNSLNAKLLAKAKLFPEQVKLPEEGLPKTFQEFDDIYTGPIHGFRDAHEYWSSNSSIHFIPGIKIPVLLINAQDDTFLSPKCYPVELAEKMKNFYLEIPEKGGHVGFVTSDKDGFYWSERRAADFILER